MLAGGLSPSTVDAGRLAGWPADRPELLTGKGLHQLQGLTAGTDAARWPELLTGCPLPG